MNNCIFYKVNNLKMYVERVFIKIYSKVFLNGKVYIYYIYNICLELN